MPPDRNAAPAEAGSWAMTPAKLEASAKGKELSPGNPIQVGPHILRALADQLLGTFPCLLVAALVKWYFESVNVTLDFYWQNPGGTFQRSIFR